jgi:5-(carboxyamino)imidazole ribonucleotide synthase
MIAIVAHELGYRVASLDPDPDAPARGVSDTFVEAGYGDIAAALRMAASCDVVTYELEHLDAQVRRPSRRRRCCARASARCA